MEHLELIKKGAVVAGRPLDFDEMAFLSEEEKASLRVELTNKWRQPKTLWLLVICCSMAAVVRESQRECNISRISHVCCYQRDRIRG